MIRAFALSLGLWALALLPAAAAEPKPLPGNSVYQYQATLLDQSGKSIPWRGLRGKPAVPMEQGRVALQASAAQLGDKARMSLQGERAVLTLTGLPAEQLTGWLAEARINARARVVESQLQRTPDGGYAGTVVLAFGSGA